MSIILESRPSSPLPARTQRRPVGHESVPRSVVTTAIDLDVTDGCNLGCPYCFKNLDKPNSMTLETAKTAFEWLLLASKGAPQVHVNFMGGEPTLRFAMMKDFVAWARPRAKAAGKSVYFSFTSNMTLWADEIRQWVDQNGIGVLMSIDGTPDVQDMSRPGKGGKKYGDTVMKWARSMRPDAPSLRRADDNVSRACSVSLRELPLPVGRDRIPDDLLPKIRSTRCESFRTLA
jgi:uncharacterized protein